jgi:hypothetical protein
MSSAGRDQVSDNDQLSKEVYPQLSPVSPDKYDPTLPQWQEWRRRNKTDKNWEWKTRIAFYGRVLDQNNAPVAGAVVEFQWTDTSSKGTSNRQTTSDGDGFFKLENIQGKNLGVEIHKNGYVSSRSNPRGFEYAAFFDRTYYVPEPNKPVIFRMQKTGVTEELVARSGDLVVPPTGSLGINLITGKEDQQGAHLFVDLLDNSDPKGNHWLARVRAPTGGVQPVKGEFTTTAPGDGYLSEFVMTQESPNTLQSDTLYKGGRFFVKTSAGYAVVEIRMIPGNRDLRFTSYLNPNMSSRNLEHSDAR